MNKKNYVVVTKAQMRGGKFITHAYGPYIKSETTRVKRDFQDDAKEQGYKLEVNVCKMILIVDGELVDG